jgi:integrase
MPKPSSRHRSPHEGSVYRTGNRWRGALTWTESDGTRRRRVVSGRTQAEARERLDAVRRELGLGAVPPKGRAVTLGEYVEQWLPTLATRVRPATIRGYTQHLHAYILPALGRVALRDLTPAQVERLLASIVASGRSPTTTRSIRTTLGLLLHDAQREGVVVKNVAALARAPHVERRELRVLTADETRRLIDRTEDDDFGPLFTLAALTGLREGELLALAWSDVELDGPTPTLTVRHAWSRTLDGGYLLAAPKTPRSRRTIELPPTAVRALRRQRARQNADRLVAGRLWQNVDNLVFVDSVGRPLRPWVVSKTFSASLFRLGLPHVRFHDLRHGTASVLLAQGTPLKLVSEQLGHSSITITSDVYSHLSREQKRAASDALERALGAGQ